MDHPWIIAIDGKAGVGKSTLGRYLAAYYGYPLFETGLLYRALAARPAAASETDVERLVKAIHVTPAVPCDDGLTQQLLSVNGERLQLEDMMTPDVDRRVGALAARPEVRAAILRVSRQTIGLGPAVVLGRDAGAAVVPTAGAKIYLTARSEARMRRLALERAIRDPSSDADSAARRRISDETTLLAAHVGASSGALVLDTTDLTIAEVRARVLDHLAKVASGG